MGLLNRVKSWLLPTTAQIASVATNLPNNGTAVAGFVQRMPAEVEIITASNMARSLAALMPPAIAAATPLRTIPLFLVPATVEPAEVEIIHNARPEPKLQLVHSADREIRTSMPAATFMLAARLSSVAQLNTVVGKKAHKQPVRQCAQANAKARAKAPNRPTTEILSPVKASKGNKAPQCFVRPQATGSAIVVSVPKRAKRRVG